MSVSFEQLQQVNTECNQQPYVARTGANEPDDWWTDVPIPGNSFMCRDYVLYKADRLIALGVSKLNMSVVLCWTEPVIPPTADNHGGREYHAVLLVYGTYILDNRFDPIYTMDANPHGYIWDRKQVSGTVNFTQL